MLSVCYCVRFLNMLRYQEYSCIHMGELNVWIGSTTFVLHMIGPTQLCPYTFVPRHDYAQTWLWPHTFVPTHVFAHTRLCPDTFMPRHDCAQTGLCPDAFVPRHVCALVPQHELLWPNTIMSLVNNNIIIVSTRLITVCVILISENTTMPNCCRRSEVWLFN